MNINDKSNQHMLHATLSPTSVVPTPSSSTSSFQSTQEATSDGSHSNANCASSSPASVTMVHSASLTSLLPSGAATVNSSHRKHQATTSTVIPKPFFVMDWLEEINPKDLELARQMLQTPRKKKKERSQLQDKHPEETTHQQSSSRPEEGQQQQRESPPLTSSRSCINLPTLSFNAANNHRGADNQEEEYSICRRLYPEMEDEQPLLVGPLPEAATSICNNDQEELSTMTDSKDKDDATTTKTPTTSNSKAKTAPETPPRRSGGQQHPSTPHSNATTGDDAAPTAAKMSPFRKRSIAIGNGWNAKGLHKAKKGSWESALACWENALVIRQQVLGETHPDVANTCNNIGIALGKLGRYDAALEILENALELRARHYGTREHVEVAATLHNIGNVLAQAQDSAGAIQCFWDAKLLQERLLGPDNIQVARACIAIANVYNEASQYQDAREAYVDALQIFANAGLEETHPEVVAVREDLRDMEQAIVAYQYHQQAVYQQQWHQNQHHYHYQHSPPVTTNTHLQYRNTGTNKYD